MSKLDEIRGRWSKETILSIGPDDAMTAAPEDIAWCLARIERLEAALCTIAPRYPETHDLCAEALREGETP